MTMIERMPSAPALRGKEQTAFRREPLAIPSGNTFVRLITARAIASACRTNVADVAAYLWPSDKLVERAASAPAMTTVTGWAAELARKIVIDSLDALGAASAGAQVLKVGMVLNFDGAGIISAPGFVASAGNAGFVQEGQPIPVRQLALGPTQMSPYKLAAIGVLTREMMESSNIEQLVSDVLIRAAGLALDAALFDSNAATAARPAGLRNGVAALTASNNADAFGAAFEDLAALMNAVSAVGGSGPYAIVLSPGRAISIAGRYRDPQAEMRLFSVHASTAVGNDIICVAPAALVSALSPEPEIETSSAGTLHMSDTPTVIVDGGTMASPTKSLFQTETTALKMRWPVTWALRDTRGVAWVTPTWK